MSARVLLEVPISFDVGGEVTHAPMIEVEVGGTATKLIVDTGSTDHVLTTELAERAGLEVSPGEPGTDSVGASVPSWTLGEVPVRIGGLDIRLQNVVAIAGPEPFEGWGIGGFLSPQHVHPSAWTVIDLVDGALTFVGGEGADVIAWVADRYPALDMLSLERESGDSTVLVRAAIEPFDPVVTMLDTGGKRTEFAEAAVPTLVGGAPTESGRGVGGATAIGSEVNDQVLRVGSATLPVPSLLVRKEIGTAQGLVGMDLLRGTSLVVSADPSRPVLWLLSPSVGRPPGRGTAVTEVGAGSGRSRGLTSGVTNASRDQRHWARARAGCRMFLSDEWAMGHLHTVNGPSRSWMWRAVSAAMILVLAGCSGPTPPSETPSPSAAAGSCPAIDLLTPQGNHIDLSGEWRGSDSSYAISQVGSCVWFVALSRWPDNPVGEDWLFAFRGTLAPDVTMSGEWAMVYMADYVTRPTGRLAYRIEFDDTAGVEEIILRRSDLTPPIFSCVVCDFPAEELRRVP